MKKFYVIASLALTVNASAQYTKLLDFAGTGVTIVGQQPLGTLCAASDGKLYGLTYQDGANNLGVLFQYNPTTNIYTKNLDFAGATNGSYPQGSLMQASDGMLYGMTSAGGANSLGVLFQYNPSTNVYTKKLDFAGATNGSNPIGSLMQASDGMLYGMAYQGGANSLGVLFQYNPSTNVYTKKLDFAGATNGSNPIGSLMQA
ncbi:MAG: choice-of-anchor tandem repeat GloVer-containing protein, partial [Bacteroidia bacterium]